MDTAFLDRQITACVNRAERASTERARARWIAEGAKWHAVLFGSVIPSELMEDAMNRTQPATTQIERDFWIRLTAYWAERA